VSVTPLQWYVTAFRVELERARDELAAPEWSWLVGALCELVGVEATRLCMCAAFEELEAPEDAA